MLYHRENVFLNWILIGLLIISGAAFAQGILGNAEKVAFDYAKVDIDADGFVTITESRQVQGLPEVFTQVDANGDGKLDVAEYAAALRKITSPGGATL